MKINEISNTNKTSTFRSAGKTGKHFRAALILCLAAIMCMASAVMASAMDYDSEVSPNGKIHGAMTATHHEDVYKMVLPSSGRLTLNAKTETTLLTFNIYDSSDDRVGLAELHDGETVSYDLTKGVYYLKFSHLVTIGTRNYDVTTSFASAGKTYETDNDTLNKVRGGSSVGLNSKINGFIAQNKDVEYYKVTLKKAGALSLGLHCDMTAVEYTLYDGDGKTIIESAEIAQGDESRRYDLAPGDYFLRFRYARTSGTRYGKYSFTTKFTSANETYTYENNSINLVRAKASIPIAKTIKGQIALNDAKDFYKVKIPKTGQYSIVVNSKVSRSKVKFYDSSDKLITSYTHGKGKKTYKISLKKGNNYIAVETADGGGTGTYSIKVRPTSVSLKSITPAKKSFEATWKKGTGSGYELQYSTGSSFKKNVKTVRIKRTSTTSKKVNGLKKGKKYYVRVRSYVKSGSKYYYSAWSSVRTVKTK